MNVANFTFGSVHFEGLAFCFALGSGSVRFILGLFQFLDQKEEHQSRASLKDEMPSWVNNSYLCCNHAALAVCLLAFWLWTECKQKVTLTQFSLSVYKLWVSECQRCMHR